MPSIFKQFLNEKFVYVSVLFMIPVTIFTAMGLMPIDAWRHDALWALGILISGHTLEGVAGSIVAPRSPGADQSSTAAVTVNVPAAAAVPVAVPEDRQVTRPMTVEELKTPAPAPPAPIRSGDDK